VFEQENSMARACAQCNKPLGEPREPSHQPPRKFCSARCRGRFWREKRDREVLEAREQVKTVREALDTARLALERAQEAMGTGEAGP
jgi:hypothetical protein